MKKTNVSNGNSQIRRALALNKNASDKIPVSSNEQKVFIGEGEGEEAMKAARALFTQ